MSVTLTDRLSNCPIVHQLTETIHNIGPFCKHSQSVKHMLSPFIDMKVDDVLLQSATSHFLSSSTFLNGVR